MTITDDLAVVRAALHRVVVKGRYGDAVGWDPDTEALAALDRIEREFAEEVSLNESAIRARLAEAERLLRVVFEWGGRTVPAEWLMEVEAYLASREQEDR